MGWNEIDKRKSRWGLGVRGGFEFWCRWSKGLNKKLYKVIILKIMLLVLWL